MRWLSSRLEDKLSISAFYFSFFSTEVSDTYFVSKDLYLNHSISYLASSYSIPPPPTHFAAVAPSVLLPWNSAAYIHSSTLTARKTPCPSTYYSPPSIPLIPTTKGRNPGPRSRRTPRRNTPNNTTPLIATLPSKRRDPLRVSMAYRSTPSKAALT
jgi:hypothetical protein